MPLRHALATLAIVTAVGTLAPAVADAQPRPGPTARSVAASSPRHDQLRRALAHRAGDVVLVAEVGDHRDLTTVARSADRGPGDVTHVLRKVGRVSVRVPAERAAAEATRLRELPGVRGVTRSALRNLSDVPNDPDYAKQQAAYLARLSAPAAWSRTHGAKTVKIAVVDSGVDIGHADLDEKIVGRYNAHDGSTNVTDQLGHGTFVAGVAAAETNNRTGVAGIGYDTSILAVKVGYPDPSAPDGYAITGDEVAAGVIWAADHGADIINLSLGSSMADPTEADAVSYAESQGVLVVAAAGNEHTTAPNYPAADPGVIAVGATDGAGHRAGFSNHGAWVTLAAPGVNIHSTAPRAGSSLFPSRNYATGDGTSFSAPLTAGVAALLLATYPDATADQLRDALVASGDQVRGLDLGAGEIDANTALSALRPTSTPGVPFATGEQGDVTLQVASSAPRVRFSVDGVALPTVAANGGNALATFASWGFANGDHEVRAADCTAVDSCTAPGQPASFRLANDAPAVTAPVEGAQLTGGFDVTADAPGGGVAFLVDDKRVAFDGTAPYAAHVSGSALADKAQRIVAVECTASGGRCEGPGSAPVNVTTNSLHPAITSVSPSPFSPNADRVKDTATITYSLPGTESVRVSVLDAAGNVARGAALGTLAAGTHTWTWNGRGTGNIALANGTYTIELDTAAGDVLGQVTRAVALDVTLPSLAGITGNRATFNPVRDGYRDAFAPGVRLSETATLTLQIRTARNRVVRSITATKPAGLRSLSWNGTDSHNRAVAAGAYRWQFIAIDRAGNRRASATYSVTRSNQRLVTLSRTLTKNATSGRYFGPSCTGLYRSAYRRGLDIVNQCNPNSTGPELIDGEFAFSLPPAVSYVLLAVSARGLTSYEPTELVAAYFRTDGDAPEVRERDAFGAVTTTYSFAGVAPSGHILRRVANVALAVSNTYTSSSVPSEFDLASVSLRVTYKVLR